LSIKEEDEWKDHIRKKHMRKYRLKGVAIKLKERRIDITKSRKIGGRGGGGRSKIQHKKKEKKRKT
jgi:hypothetical protein